MGVAKKFGHNDIHYIQTTTSLGGRPCLQYSPASSTPVCTASESLPLNCQLTEISQRSVSQYNNYYYTISMAFLLRFYEQIELLRVRAREDVASEQRTVLYWARLYLADFRRRIIALGIAVKFL